MKIKVSGGRVLLQWYTPTRMETVIVIDCIPKKSPPLSLPLPPSESCCQKYVLYKLHRLKP